MLRKFTIFLSFLSFACVFLQAQTYVRKSNLPHLYIETFDRAPINSKEVYVYATMYYVDEADVVTQYDSMQIRGRGNSTWGLRKKPYRIKFHEKEKFLGKGYAKAKNWTLMANAADHSLMRNAITSLMGDYLGLKNNPAHKFVDVTLNGTFIGNYQISDKIDVRPHRVNITEQDLPLTPESDITGGYLLEVDGFRDGNYFTTSTYQVPIRIHYPDDEDINYAQNEYIRQYMKDFEKVLSGDNFADATDGYRAWVDSTSLVNWFIATEVSGNVDGYYSTYFYKDQQDSLLYWGPLWDYDIAYNNDNRTDRGGGNNTEYQLMTDHGYGATKNWINRMWQDPWFGKLVNRRYAEVVEAGLEDYLNQQIDSIAELLQESQELNFNKWGISTRMLRERVLFSSYDQYVSDLKAYLGVHIPYLQTAFAEKKVAEPTPPFVPANYYYTIANANNGKVFDTVDKTGDAGDFVCSWELAESQYSQQWKILPVGDYFMLVNRNGGMALNDPTAGVSTPTTNVGTQLNTALADAEDDRQLWSIVPQGTEGYYNLVNKYTGHTANQNGGGSTNGTSILSYTTDSRNSSSKNRLWYFTPTEEIEEIIDPDNPDNPDNPENPDKPDNPENPDNPDNPENPDNPDNPLDPDDPSNPSDDPSTDAIASVEPAEYALGYNSQTKTLHFGAEEPELLTFAVHIYSSNGQHIRTFRASEQCSVADFPRGMYIITWRVSGKTRSTKLMVR